MSILRGVRLHDLITVTQNDDTYVGGHQRGVDGDDTPM
jgi:hypothetical protein